MKKSAIDLFRKYLLSYMDNLFNTQMEIIHVINIQLVKEFVF